MTDATIVRTHRVASASSLIDTIAASLTAIKDADDLSDTDLGGVMHKHRDQAAKYRTGLAEMPVTAFLRGCALWNGRFANDVLALIGMKMTPIDAGEPCGRTLQTRLARLMYEVSVAMEDGEISEHELAGMKRTLVEAGEAIEAMRAAA